LPGDTRPERFLDAAREAASVIRIEPGRGTKRVDTRAPQRLVDVDVPEAGHRPLVEQGGLDRRTPTGEAGPEPARGECASEWLDAEAVGEVRLDLIGLEQVPGAEATDVFVPDVRSVV
jgi:hypothetical protein